MNKKKIILLSLLALVLLVIGGWLALWFVFLIPFRIPTGSMANTIIPKETVLAKRRFSEIKRGDIFAFKFPPDPKILYLQRVIGLPGETIQIKDKKVFVDGKEIPETRMSIELNIDESGDGKPHKVIGSEGAGKYAVYVDTSTGPIVGMKFGVNEPYKIPNDSYFVLGDCRDNSMDSRFWGTVPKNNFVAKVFLIYDSPIPNRFFTKLEIE